MTHDQRFVTPSLVVEETGTFVPEQQVYLQLVRTAEMLKAETQALFERHGLSGKQYNVLRALRRGGPDGLATSEIARQMVERDPDLTRLVDRLARMGLVDRRPDATDRRVTRVALTLDGASRLAELDAPVVETHRRQLGHLTPRELKALAALLVKARGEPA